MRFTLALTLCVAAVPVAALDLEPIEPKVMRDNMLAVLESEFSSFRDQAALLNVTAQGFCDGQADRADLDQALRDTWLAWAPLDSYQFGPIEQTGAALTVNFWPDKKNFTGRALRDLLALSQAEQADPAVIAAGSAAGQGLGAIEMLLHEDLPECPLVVGISGNLAGLSDQLYTGWFGPEGWADLVRHPGPDNPVYLDDMEFVETIFTALDFGLERVKDQRLGRPLGTFDRPFPTRAEGWRAGLSLDIALAQLDGIQRMIHAGFADIAEPGVIEDLDARFDDIFARAAAIGAPLDQAVADPAQRMRVEGLQTQVETLRLTMDQKLGQDQGIEAGFSAGDGD